MVKIEKGILRKASSFYNQVKFAGQLPRVIEEVECLLEGIENQSRFRQILQLEHVGFEKKLALISGELASISTETATYLEPYLTEDGIFYLVEALQAFSNIYHSAKLEIISAVRLSDEQVTQIAEAFQRKVGKEYDSWINTVDESVIGGVKIKTHDYIIDGTVSKKMKDFGKVVKDK